MIDEIAAVYAIGIAIMIFMAFIAEDWNYIILAPVWPLFYLKVVWNILR